MVFDFDGTLFDTKKDIAASVNYALKSVGREPLSEDVIWRATGGGSEVLVRRIAEKATESQREEILRKTLEYYSKHFADFVKPVDSVCAFLKKFAHKKKVILSNKNKELIDKILKKYDIDRCFIGVFGGDSFEKKKPDPAPLLEVIDIFGVKMEETIYIGDSMNDILTAKGAGLRCFIIPSGVSSVEEIEKAKPDKIFYDYTEIENFIE